MHIDKRKSKNNVTVSDRHKECCQNNEWDPSICSDCDFFFCINNFTDKDKLTELKQMLDEVRSYKVNINQDFYYKLSEALI